MKLNVLVVPGDGIGPEVTGQATQVLRAIADLGGHDFRFQEMPIGGAAIKQLGTPLPRATLEAALGSDAVLLGAVGGNEFNSLPPDRAPRGRPAAIAAGTWWIRQSSAVVCLSRAGIELSAAARGCGRRRHSLCARTARRTLFR